MASLTKQTSTNSGSDVTTGTRTQQVQSTAQKTSHPVTTRQDQTEDPVVTTEVRGPSTQSSVETSEGQSSTTTEDHAFTLTVSIPLKGALPCDEIPIP